MKYCSLYKMAVACSLMVVLLTACFDDKGNYDYREINDVTIEGISRDKVYELFAYQSTLEITPVIHSTIGDGADYEYTWRIVPRNATDENGTLDKYVVSHEKNLVYPVQLEDGDYTGFFEVKDPETGVTWIVDFYMQVKSQGSEGWLAVCEDNGRTRLDLIGKNSDGEDVLFADLWKNNDFEMGTPQKFFFVGDNYGSSFRFPILTTDKGTYSIMGNDFHIGEDTDMKWYFGLGGDRVDIMQTAVELFTVSGIPSWWVINEKGEIYQTEEFSDRAFFSYPINKLDGRTEFEAAPYLGISYTYNDIGADWDYNYATVLYDKTNRRFLSKYGANNYPSLMKCSGNQLFEVETGRDMVYMDSHVEVDGLVVAVLKDPSAPEYYLYGLTLGYGKIEQTYYGKIGGPVADAKFFALHPVYNSLFYGTKNKVYRVSLSDPEKEPVEVVSLEGEEIVTMKFNKILGYYEDTTPEVKDYMDMLLVGTHKEAAPEGEENVGTFRLYEIPSLATETVTEKKKIEGLGKIVDIVYKERAS